MKPTDFYVTAMDVFAILMPGALLAYLFLPMAPALFGPLLPPLDSDAKQWSAFGVTAYLLGHLLHQMGSLLDARYDAGYAAEKRRFGEDALTARARALARHDLGADADVMSLYEWAGSYVRAHHPAAASELDRAGGDSKFFRSLCMVCVVAVPVFLVKGHVPAALGATALAAFAYRRFCSQRWKATQIAYGYFVLLRQLPPGASRAAAAT